MTVRRRNYGMNHAYYDVAPDGTEVKLDGVTSLVGDGVPKPWMGGWASKTCGNYVVDHWAELAAMQASERLAAVRGAPWGERDAAANKGTLIHKLAEPASRGEEVELPPELESHIRSCIAFLDDYEFQPTATELTVINRAVRYAGTLDAVGSMLGRQYLIDWKTGRDVYAETALQLAAYAHAEAYLGADRSEHPMAELGIERGAVVHLRADGYDVYPVDIGEAPFLAFRHVAWVARLTRSDKDETGAYRSLLDDWKGRALQPPARQEAAS